MENGFQVNKNARTQILESQSLFNRFALVLLLSSWACLAQETSRCSFSTFIGGIYTCRLDNINTATEFDFVNLSGNHDAGRTDSDVTRLDFFHGRMLTAFPEMVFDRFPNLHTVFVTGNLQVNRFALQSRCDRLRNFWFEGPANAITTLENGVFRNCFNLHEIRVHRSSVATIEANVFADTPNLRSLILARNVLHSLPANVFSGLTQLEFLDLERNMIIDLAPQIFQGLPNLRMLQCGQLNKRDWPSGLFTNLPSLVEIDINFSGLQTIQPGTFGNLPMLQIIRIYGEVRRLRADIFSTKMPMLHTFNINRNQIEAIERGFFDNLPALRNVIALHNVCINREFLNFLDWSVMLSAFEMCFLNF